MKKIEKTDILSKVLGGRSFSVDVFQREYRWGSKHIEDMLTDFQNCFENEFDPAKHDSLKAVADFGYYFMGQITCVVGSGLSIVDPRRFERDDFLMRIIRKFSNLVKNQYLTLPSATAFRCSPYGDFP